MRDDRFEWDDRKAASNLRKHKISFAAARWVFDDLFAFDEDDPDPDEQRWLKIGLSRDLILAVVYTQRGSRI